MPRLSRALLAAAWKRDPLLPLLLRSCRDSDSARQELRWLKEHAVKIAESNSVLAGHANPSWKMILLRFCQERGRGRPLQYILGSEFFGPLEIACKPGVLIPRPETAASVLHLVDRFRHSKSTCLPKKLKVLDLCSGTGCISLLFAHQFPFQETRVEEMEVLGIDISPKAVALARENQRAVCKEFATDESADERRRAALSNTRFICADIFITPAKPITTQVVKNFKDFVLYRNQPTWDIIISNPPYISPQAFARTTTRSVRNYEPKLALVPGVQGKCINDDDHGDIFYPRLLEIAKQVSAKVLLVEVSDMAQAERVARMAQAGGGWDGIQIWCDELGQVTLDQPGKFDDIKLVGRGDGRSVFCWRNEAGFELDGSLQLH